MAKRKEGMKAKERTREEKAAAKMAKERKK
jgi:hypothetical protein